MCNHGSMIARRARRRADHEYTSRSPWRLALAGAVTALVVSAVGIVSPLGSAASPSGWYVATTPATGADDILLGSSCPNALQCFAAGISIQNINSNGTFSPIVETWNGTTWTLAPQPSLPSRPGRRAVRRLLRDRVRLLGGRGHRRRERERGSDRDPHRELERQRLVRRAEPDPDRARSGGRAPAGRELHVGVQLLRRRVLDGPERERSQRRDRAVERRELEHRPRRRHRPALRWALHRAMPRRRRLLGGGQRGSRAAEPQLPPHLPGRGR